MRHNRQRVQAGLLLAGTVFFAILGQYYLTQRRDYLWDGIIFIGIALLCFGWLVTMAGRSVDGAQDAPGPDWRARGRQVLVNRRTAIVVLAVLLNWTAARSASAQPSPHDFSLSILLWLSSLALCFIAFAQVSHILPNLNKGLHSALCALRRKDWFDAELALVFGLVLIGLILRGPNSGAEHSSLKPALSSWSTL